MFFQSSPIEYLAKKQKSKVPSPLKPLNQDQTSKSSKSSRRDSSLSNEKSQKFSSLVEILNSPQPIEVYSFYSNNESFLHALQIRYVLVNIVDYGSVLDLDLSTLPDSIIETAKNTIILKSSLNLDGYSRTFYCEISLKDFRGMGKLLSEK